MKRLFWVVVIWCSVQWPVSWFLDSVYVCWVHTLGHKLGTEVIAGVWIIYMFVSLVLVIFFVWRED